MRALILVALAGCGIDVPPCSGEPTPGADRVLVFSRTRDYRHEAITAGCSALPALLADHGIGVDLTEDPAAFTADNLARFGAVFFFYTSGDDLLDAAGRLALEDFVRAGGGWVGIHSAAASETAWPFYRELVAADFTFHADIQVARVRIEDLAHPATSELPAEWLAADEWYNFAASPRGRPGVHVLAAVDERSFDGGTLGDDHPIAWSHDTLGGRALYTALGHPTARWDDPLFRAHVAGGLRWAMHLTD